MKIAFKLFLSLALMTTFSACNEDGANQINDVLSSSNQSISEGHADNPKDPRVAKYNGYNGVTFEGRGGKKSNFEQAVPVIINDDQDESVGIVAGGSANPQPTVPDNSHDNNEAPSNSNGSSTSGSTDPNPITEITGALCQRMMDCEPNLSDNGCVMGVLYGDGIADEFLPEDGGVGSYEYLLMIDVAQGFSLNSYVKDLSVYSSCLAAITALNCEPGEGTIESGYDYTSAPTNFDNIENFIPDVCQGAINTP